MSVIWVRGEIVSNLPVGDGDMREEVRAAGS
jgi:hypothetical protein